MFGAGRGLGYNRSPDRLGANGAVPISVLAAGSPNDLSSAAPPPPLRLSACGTLANRPEGKTMKRHLGALLLAVAAIAAPSAWAQGNVADVTDMQALRDRGADRQEGVRGVGAQADRRRGEEVLARLRRVPAYVRHDQPREERHPGRRHRPGQAGVRSCMRSRSRRTDRCRRDRSQGAPDALQSPAEGACRRRRRCATCSSRRRSAPCRPTTSRRRYRSSNRPPAPDSRFFCFFRRTALTSAPFPGEPGPPMVGPSGCCSEARSCRLRRTGLPDPAPLSHRTILCLETTC